MNIIKMSCLKITRRSKIKKFTNWPETIINKTAKIYYPKTDDDIKTIINKAKKKNYIVRVVGVGHTETPLVCNSNEKNIYLVSLEEYNKDAVNIHINHKEMTVDVNAGWTLGQLYDFICQYNYYLPTHPDIPVFTIGGIISSTIHGSRLGASVLSDYVLAVTLIDSDGNRIIKTKDDPDFDLYTLNFGIFGIIVNVKFKLEKHFIESKVTNYYNIFKNVNGQSRIKHEIMDKFFLDIIQKCLEPELDENAVYNHSFIDFHNSALTSIEWKNNPDKISNVDNSKEITELLIVKPLEVLLKNFIIDYRRNHTLLKILGKLIRHQIALGIENNAQDDRDMFWVQYGLKAHYMSYFVPIHTEGDLINLDKLYNAIEIVANEIERFKLENKHFNIDLPMDIRFVTSSKNCLLSPINNHDKKIIYVSIEIMTLADNLLITMDDTNFLNKKLNRDFREFYKRIEEQWIVMGGVPHLSKIFGFSGPNNDPLDPVTISKIYPEDIKNGIKEKIQKLFMNDFVRKLFGVEKI
jgi:UDP-N-acetylenolpyruvoylglucosamine reductase